MSRGLALILLAYMLLAGAYVLAVPAWEAPDEPAHFFYAAYLADHGQPPEPTGPQPDPYWIGDYVTSGYEWHQPPSYYAVASALLSLNRRLGLLPAHTVYPPINPKFPIQARALFVPGSRQPQEMYLLRALSVLCGLVTIWATYALGRLIGAGLESGPPLAWLPELSAGLVAFLPQFTFIHAYVTNDSLALAAVSLALLALVRAGSRGLAARPADWFLAGLAASLALSVKLTAGAVVLAGIAVCFWNLLAAGRGARRVWAGLGAYLVALPWAPLLVAAAWPRWAAQWLQDPSRRIDPAHLNPAFFAGLWPVTHFSFWGGFGWVNVALPLWMYRVFDACLLLGLAAAIWTIARRWGAFTPGGRRALAILLAAPLLALLQFLLFNLTISQPQGRLLFPGLAALAVVMAYGWLTLAELHAPLAAEQRARRRGFVTLALLATWCGLNMLALTGTLLPAYAG